MAGRIKVLRRAFIEFFGCALALIQLYSQNWMGTRLHRRRDFYSSPHQHGNEPPRLRLTWNH